MSTDNFITFEMPADTADDLVRQYLRNLHVNLQAEIRELQQRKRKTSAQIKDLRYTIIVKNSVLEVLEYLTTVNEHIEYLKKTKETMLDESKYI